MALPERSILRLIAGRRQPSVVRAKSDPPPLTNAFPGKTASHSHPSYEVCLRVHADAKSCFGANPMRTGNPALNDKTFENFGGLQA